MLIKDLSPQRADVIIIEFQKYIAANDSLIGHWYVGITEAPERRVFQEHGVSDSTPYIILKASTDEDARAVEQVFLDRGADGGGGGGDSQAVYVYAYLKRQGTNP